MSRDDERYRDRWEDAGEDDNTPPARFRDGYQSPRRPNTPPRRAGRTPREDASGRPRPRQANSGDSRDTPGRARSHQQANDGAYSDPRNTTSPQRPRPPSPSRRPRQPAAPGPARGSRAYEYDDDYNEAESTEDSSPRPRIARQDRAQVEARRRQRQRQPIQPPYAERERATPPGSGARYNEEAYDYYNDEDRYAYAVPQRGRAMREPEYEDDYLPARRPQAQRKRRRGRGILRSFLFIVIGALVAVALIIAGFAFFVLHNTPLG